MTYGDFKDLARRTVSDKVLKDKAFDIAKIQNMICIKEALLLWFIIFLIKSLPHLQINLLKKVLLIMKSNKMTNWLKNYANQLLKILKKIKNYLSFKDNVWVTDLADMQLISKLNTGTRFLLCIIEHGLLL